MSFTAAGRNIIKLLLVLVLAFCDSVGAVVIPTRTTSRWSSLPSQRFFPHRRLTSTISTVRMANTNDATNPSAATIPPISPVQVTTSASITNSGTTDAAGTSSATVKRGFGTPPPQPSGEELEAKGKRAAQKAKYREAIKMAKKMPMLRKIVSSGKDEKVSDRTNAKGAGYSV